MSFDSLNLEAVPMKPVFFSEDLRALFGWSASRLSQVRKKGHLRNLPGYSKVAVPRLEVLRYVWLLDGKRSNGELDTFLEAYRKLVEAA